MTFGGWMLPAFKILRHLKVLRGTPLDPFGYTRERRQERALIQEYKALLLSALDRITSDNYASAMKLAGSANIIRGYGPVKEANVRRWRAEVAALQLPGDETAAGVPPKTVSV